MKALIFANGKAKKGVMVSRALFDSQDALIIAADGGARVAKKFGFMPDVIIGDMDSISAEELTDLQSNGTEIHRYPAEKNETDLELALMYAAEQNSKWIRILGAFGGRFDQTLANVYLMALPQLVDCDVALVAGNQMIRLYRSGEHQLQGQIGDTVSLLPISGDVKNISTENLKYTLKNETLDFGLARGISNVMENEIAHIRFDEGWLLCVHTEGRA